MSHILQGVWPALVTPTNPDYSVNVPVLRKLVDYLTDKGVHGFYVGGSTGDGIFMPVPQRKLLAEAVMSHLDGRVPVVIHVGAVASDDAIELSRHAVALGAVGISSVIPPLYDNMSSIYAYYQAIAAAVPDTPILAYLLNPTINSASLMAKLAEIPNIAGAKYTGPDMYELRQIIDIGNGRWSVFSGMDEEAVFGCMMGTSGIIGSTLNIMPGVYLHIRQHIQRGEYAEAQELQIKANRVVTIMTGSGFKGALRVVLSRLLGSDVGEPRLPALPLTDEQHDTLMRELDQTDFAALAAL